MTKKNIIFLHQINYYLFVYNYYLSNFRSNTLCEISRKYVIPYQLIVSIYEFLSLNSLIRSRISGSFAYLQKHLGNLCKTGMRRQNLFALEALQYIRSCVCPST